MKCPKIDMCPVFPYFDGTPLVRKWKARYCEWEFSQCHRFQCAERGEDVPLELMPNGSAMDKKLLITSLKDWNETRNTPD